MLKTNKILELEILKMVKPVSGQRAIIIFTLLFANIICNLYSQKFTDKVASPDTMSSKRWREPTDSIVADLESYIPVYIQEHNIPGVAIALIQGGKVVRTRGYGVTNSITEKPVNAETLFEVASNSKLITAYIALRLVDQGKLALDEPLNQYLSEPWLPSSQYRDTITLRHVLSHSSGLGHLTFSRECLFPPGRGFYYSNKGYLYLQAVIEEVSGQPLEEVARELVFRPLEMSSSSFINHNGIVNRTANGHIHVIIPLMFFIIPYLLVLIFISMVGLPVHRIWKGQWKIRSGTVWITLIVVFVLVILPLFFFLGPYGLSKFAWLIAFCGIGVSAAIASVFFIVRLVVQRIFKKRSKYKGVQITILTLLMVAILLGLVYQIEIIPVPKWPVVPAGAASTLRATAGDLAKFLIELSDSKFLTNEIAEQLKSPQVQLAEKMSWGLGPGLQQSHMGTILWQWGQNLDFQSFLIVYPEHGFGVVVMTNNDVRNPDVAINIAQHVLGDSMDLILQAAHLDFNYRPGM